MLCSFPHDPKFILKISPSSILSTEIVYLTLKINQLLSLIYNKFSSFNSQEPLESSVSADTKGKSFEGRKFFISKFASWFMIKYIFIKLWKWSFSWASNFHLWIEKHLFIILKIRKIWKRFPNILLFNFPWKTIKLLFQVVLFLVSLSWFISLH